MGVPVAAGAAPPSQFTVWLRRGVRDYLRHFGSREFLRNNFNITVIGGAISVIDQIWINGSMPLAEVIHTRLVATFVDLAGAGDVTVSGHGEWLRLWKITPETPSWKRRLVEWPVVAIGMAAWNFAQYLIGGVAREHYVRSVLISTAIGVVVQMGVLRCNAILNNYATNDPRFCRSLSAQLSRAAGCERLGARTKRSLYWILIMAMNAFMIANWICGFKLRRWLLGH